MFTIKLDEKWLEEQMKELREDVPAMIKSRLQNNAHGIIYDMVKQAIVEEMAKPANKKLLQEMAKKILVEQKSEEMIQYFLRGHGRY